VPDPDASLPDVAETLDTVCEAISDEGYVDDCSACAEQGLDCDTLDLPTGEQQVCGCSSGPCPCGLQCGSIEVVPGVLTVGDVCVP